MPVILVIEDSSFSRQIVSRLLESEGFQTIQATCGKEAYASLYSRKPDLVLLELMMPDMDGLTFLRMLRNSSMWERIPVLGMTDVQEDRKMVARAKSLRLDGVVHRDPAELQDLLAHVRNVIRDMPPTNSNNNSRRKVRPFRPRERVLA